MKIRKHLAFLNRELYNAEKKCVKTVSSTPQSGHANMKIFNLILAVLFFISAAVQLNDTPGDVLFWVLIYSYVAIISAFAAFRKYNMWSIVLGLAVVVYELFRKFPTFAQWISDGMPSIIGEMQASTPYVELVREYLGLSICLVVLIYHYVKYAGLSRKG